MATGAGRAAAGTTPAGSAPADLFIANAFAVGSRLVRVTLSRPAFRGQGTTPGSVLNPTAWQLVRLDTSAAVPLLAVAEFDAPLTYDLATFHPLGGGNVTHRIMSSRLLASNGVRIGRPRLYDFPGIMALEEPARARATGRRGLQRDLASRDTADTTRYGGTLVITSAGDYALQGGTALLRKLVLRRLLTMPGEIFHLPEYGLGLRVKEPLPDSDLVKLGKKIEQSVQQEPEVASCKARLSLLRNSILIVQLQIRLRKTGEALDMQVRAAPDGMSF